MSLQHKRIVGLRRSCRAARIATSTGAGIGTRCASRTGTAAARSRGESLAVIVFVVGLTLARRRG